ncbi:hypothetical protein M758_UG083300 [Ceratodon purpureus]|nr:hypothetical protein M758_UG083300 [Ceratodon purpureus]
MVCTSFSISAKLMVSSIPAIAFTSSDTSSPTKIYFKSVWPSTFCTLPSGTGAHPPPSLYSPSQSRKLSEILAELALPIRVSIIGGVSPKKAKYKHIHTSSPSSPSAPNWTPSPPLQHPLIN